MTTEQHREAMESETTANQPATDPEPTPAPAAAAPVELLLVETDAPFLTPMPFRGRPNAPYLVPLTVRALAAVQELDLTALCVQLADNGRRAFALP